MERTTMPDQFFEHPRLRRWAWPFTIGLLTALAITVVVLAVIGYSLRRDVSELRTAERVSEVATCYAQARGRPALIVILELLAGIADAQERNIINSYIEDYDDRTPTVDQCDRLAIMRGLSPENFPPVRVPPTGGR